MRDILVTIVIFGLLPFIFTRPHIGILLWSWIGYMVPHRLAWGFAYNFPFAAIVGGVTLIACVASMKNLRFFWAPVMGWLLFFNFWMLVTTIFSLQPDDSLLQWKKVIKIQLIVFLTIFVMSGKQNINNLIWIIVASIGFFGFKGGIFTLLTGGGAHVLGPATSFIAGNTEIGLALVMIYPLLCYLYLHTVKPWVRNGIVISLLLIPIAILGTQSRGALLAVAAMAFFLWLKSRNKLVPLVGMIMMIPLLFMFMPQSWHDRMSTIKDYDTDASAMGRIQAWTFAYKMAAARPMLGGGFEGFNAANYERFAPDLVAMGTGKYHDVHSIYFEVLGEHGFVGLIIFVILGFYYWRIAGRIMKLSKHSSENKWAYDLASMMQVSLVGYSVGGAFLGLAYFDLPYHLLAILILIQKAVEDSLAEKDQSILLHKGNSAGNTVKKINNYAGAERNA